eukprot:NODE_18993_length_865_cov_2.027100.p1 GENE.NODE_18993_length_865_cov_2.027100~~NODE_18993_length_865_cov_2.027100.p1  ORF type:complete len:195 (+),score=71.91 NODE_18993_length_865_cov_2.027100:63-647(+)
MPVVVEADDEHEAEALREAILEKAARLQRYGLVEEHEFKEFGCSDTLNEAAEHVTASSSSAVVDSMPEGTVEGGVPDDSFIVCKEALKRAEMLLSADAAAPLGSELLVALLDVPPEFCNEAGLEEALRRGCVALVSPHIHPTLCLRLAAFFGDCSRAATPSMPRPGSSVGGGGHSSNESTSTGTDDENASDEDV